MNARQTTDRETFTAAILEELAAAYAAKLSREQLLARLIRALYPTLSDDDTDMATRLIVLLHTRPSKKIGGAR